MEKISGISLIRKYQEFQETAALKLVENKINLGKKRGFRV